MDALKSIIRWLLAAFIGFGALGILFEGRFLAFLFAAAGSYIISPLGGAWLAKKIPALSGHLRPTVVGVVAFVIGISIGRENATQAPAVQVADSAQPAPVVATAQCESGTAADGAEVAVVGTNSNILHKTPGGEKIVNEKATKALGETQYQVIDNSTKVRVQCVDGAWAKIAISSPEWLAGQTGWVERAALGVSLKPGEFLEFTEKDFHWDKDTLKAKAAIIKAVNRIHREDPRCKTDIYPSSVSKSDTESKEQKKTMYFVNCGGGATSVNVYFDAKRADDPTPFRAPGHINKGEAVELCERFAKQNATHPSTVEFSRIMDMSLTEHPNGRTQIFSSFTAKNALNMELKFRIKCLLDENSFIEGNVWEDDR